MKLATLCYVRKAGHTLMVHRVKKANDIHEGKWNGLGGKLEAGESPEDCARREIFEESGLNVTNLQMKGVLTFPEFARGEDWYVFVFTAEAEDGELIDSAEGNLRWIPTDQISALNLWEGDVIFLPWLERPGFFSGRFVYVDGCLIEHSVSLYD